MDKIEYNLKEIRILVTKTGHEYLSKLPPMPVDKFRKEAKPFLKMEKIISKLEKKYKISSDKEL